MMAPLLVLDLESPIPPYEQIKAQLRQQISAGHLLPETRLPSVRQLARDLGIAPNTVARAYSELERSGWLITLPRKGVVVHPHPVRLSTEERSRQLDEAIAQLLVTAQQLGVEARELEEALRRHLNLRKENLSPLVQ